MFAMIPEAPLEQTEHGLQPGSEGWFLLNAREAVWRVWKERGKWPRLEGARPMFVPARPRPDSD